VDAEKERFSFLYTQDNPLDSILKYRNIEVYQQSDIPAAQLKVGNDLSFVNREYCFYCLDLSTTASETTKSRR
jgi:hypothetical protein